MAMNALVVVSSIVSVFYTSIVALYISRVVFGVAVGGYSVFCPKFINEVSPKEISGATGALFQVFICVGILTPYIIGIANGTKPSED